MNHFIHIGPAGGYIGRIAWSNSGYMDCRWGAILWRQLNGPTASTWWGSIGIIRYFMRCP